MEEGLRKRFEFAAQTRRLSFRPKNNDYLDRLKNNWYALDVYWIKLQIRDNWIGMIEPMCEHDFNSVSDVLLDDRKHGLPEIIAIAGLIIKDKIENGSFF